MNNKGFTLVEAIVSLLIVSLSISLIMGSLYVMKTRTQKIYTAEDYNFIYQMRILFALSMDAHLQGDMLAFRYKSQDMYYDRSDDRLILQEGYQVFLNDVEDVYFEEKKGCFYLTYKRTGKEDSSHFIGCQ